MSFKKRFREICGRSFLTLILASVVSMAVVAASLVTASPASAKLSPLPIRGNTILAMGDSYTSGEGNPPFEVGPDGQAAKCHRASTAYPVIAADLTGLKATSVACSGAKINDLFSPFKDEQPQIDRMGTADYITISIGGNDLLAWLYSVVKSENNNLTITATPADLEKLPSISEMRAQVKAIQPRLQDAYKRLQEKSPDSKIYVVGYPAILSTKAGNGCEFSWKQRVAVSYGTSVLNGMIKDAAKASNVRYIDVTNAFDGHELCTYQSYVHGKVADNLSYSFHPNVLGHKKIGEIVAKEIRPKRTISYWWSTFTNWFNKVTARFRGEKSSTSTDQP